jgi:26S proteasome non-ATPase regulatory subunit 5
MAQSSVFMQYLLDRTTDRIQQGQMWKYTIIQTIVSHPNSKEILEVDDYNQCQTYIKQGPFYKPLETTVAFESS